MPKYEIYARVEYDVFKTIEADSAEEAERIMQYEVALGECTIKSGEGFVIQSIRPVFNDKETY